MSQARPGVRCRQHHWLGITLLLAACGGAPAVAGEPRVQGDASPGSNEPASADTARNTSAAGVATSGVTRSSGVSIFVVHQVSDFDAFQKFFGGGAAERAKLGVRGYLLSRLDDGRVIIHFFADELAQVKAAFDSKELQEYLARDGAPDSSLVWLAKDARVTVPATAPSEATYSLIMKFAVQDFPEFERRFEKLHPVYAEHAVLGEGLHQSTEDERVVILHLMGTDRGKLQALLERPEFLELLALKDPAREVKQLIAEDVMRDRPE